MAEFLIKAIDATHIDPVKDVMCYKRGDIVEVYEDGRCTEPPSLSSKMVIVKVPGVTKAQVEKYMKSHEVPQLQTRKLRLEHWQEILLKDDFEEFTARPTVIQTGEDIKGVWVLLEGYIVMPITRRKFRLRVDNLPLAVKQTLQTDRWITVSLTQAKNFIRNKVTNLDEA